MSHSTAFVAGIPVLSQTARLTPVGATQFSARCTTAPVARRQSSTIRMNTPFEPETKKAPQGFTWYSEIVNGRAAMVGFFLALATELINPDHPGIIEQVRSLVDNVKHLV